MSTTHVGKIGRLPRAIRDQLGHRLQDGASAASLALWLNALPEVQAVLDAQFQGRPVTEKNLSDWRQTGHPEWLRRQELRYGAWTLADQAADLGEETGGHDLSDQFASVLALEITRLARVLLEAETDPEKRWQRLCAVNRELSQLRRDDHRAARQRIEQGRWRWEDGRLRREDDRRHEAEYRQEQCAPFVARLELPSLAAAFGGGETGRKLAASMLELKNDLPLGCLGGLTPKQPASRSLEAANEA